MTHRLSPSVALPRRMFLKTAAAATLAASLPATSWGRVLGANKRLNIGVIGVGGQGRWHVDHLRHIGTAEDVAVTRVCDVYRRRLNSAAQAIGGASNAGTMDYREILDDKDIHAVVIATPDHWHTKMAIEAMDAGKDVYCEKPLSLTIQQAIECRDAVERTGRVLQVGPNATADDRFHKARQAIASGRIGKVIWSQGSYCRNSREGQFNWRIDPDAGPQSTGDGYVDWDRWLGWEHGLAPKIPWNADHFFRFRKYWAYNGGLATDLLYHKLAPLLLAIVGPRGEYPRRVSASGGMYVEKDGRDIPDTFLMTVDYPSEHTILLVSVAVNDVGVPDVIRGLHGTMTTSDVGWRVEEQGAWWPEFRKANADHVRHEMVKSDQGRDVPSPSAGSASFSLETSPRRPLVENWLDAIREGAPLDCNIHLGCSTMVAVGMAVESYRTGKAMVWDAGAERAVGA